MVNQEIFVKKAIVRIFKTTSKMEVHPQPVSPLESARPVIVSQQSLFIRPANVVHISTETSRSATIPCSFSFFHVLSDDPVHSHTASTLDRSARARNVPLKAEEKCASECDGRLLLSSAFIKNFPRDSPFCSSISNPRHYAFDSPSCSSCRCNIFPSSHGAPQGPHLQLETYEYSTINRRYNAGSGFFLSISRTSPIQFRSNLHSPAAWSFDPNIRPSHSVNQMFDSAIHIQEELGVHKVEKVDTKTYRSAVNLIHSPCVRPRYRLVVPEDFEVYSRL
ncbi:hypothetical protein C8J56DRAFT_1174857 [Mycena floridula]|nr:hypothetical protein C8J56DRAFT_1174857 [Mycena floridula]